MSLENQIDRKIKESQALREKIDMVLGSKSSIDIDAEMAKLYQRIKDLEVEVSCQSLKLIASGGNSSIPALIPG